MNLRQSTQIKIRCGPFVDATDGVTPETGITLAAADQAELLKANGAATVDISSNTWAAVTGCDGYYDLTLTATDTNTLGDLTVVIQDSSVCLPVFARFQIVPASVYDSLIAGSDTLQADLTQIGGVAQSATDLKHFADTGYDPATGKVEGVKVVDTTSVNSDMRGTDGANTTTPPTAASIRTEIDTNSTQLAAIVADTNELQTDNVPGLIAALNDPTAAAIADAVWDELQSGHVAAGTFGELATEIAAILVDTGTTLPATLATIASYIDTEVAAILTDTGTTIPAQISALNNLSTADIDARLTAYGANTTTPPTTGQIVAALMVEAMATHTTAGSFGKLVNDVLADTNELQSDDVPGLIAAIDTLIDAIKAKTDQMVFTKANELDANTKSINSATVVGDGNATPWDGA